MELSALPTEHEVLVSLVLPILISIVVQLRTSVAMRSVIALVTCFAATVVVNRIEGDDPFQNLGAVIMTTFVAYKTFYQPTGLSTRIEQATNLDFGSDDE